MNCATDYEIVTNAVGTKIKVHRRTGGAFYLPKTAWSSLCCPRCGSPERGWAWGKTLAEDPRRAESCALYADPHPWHREGERCPKCRSDTMANRGYLPGPYGYGEDNEFGVNCDHVWHEDKSVQGIFLT